MMADQVSTSTAQSTGRFSDREYKDQADFRCALRTFMSFSEKQARMAGITPQQYLLLLIARGHRSAPNVNIGELAAALQVRHHSASLLVDRCVKRGLIQRREDPADRRRALVSLTPEGQKALDSVIAANRRELGKLEEALFRESLISTLHQYSSALDQSGGKQCR